jgi:hypothetical protein
MDIATTATAQWWEEFRGHRVAMGPPGSATAKSGHSAGRTSGCT